MYPILFQFVLSIACVAGAACAALAGNFHVTPVRVEFAAAKLTTMLRVSNPGAEPVTVQAEVLAWSYAGEVDVFSETEDVLLNPPIFTIAAGTTQYVRVGMRARNTLASEASYRILLEELPSPPKPGETEVRTLLRISLPVFVAPSGKKAVPRLQWRLTRTGAEDVLLSATNVGSAHIQLQHISLRPEGLGAAVARDLAVYLLPGQMREWKFQGGGLAAAAQIELAAKSDAGELSAWLGPEDR